LIVRSFSSPSQRDFTLSPLPFRQGGRVLLDRSSDRLSSPSQWVFRDLAERPRPTSSSRACYPNSPRSWVWILSASSSTAFASAGPPRLPSLESRRTSSRPSAVGNPSVIKLTLALPRRSFSVFRKLSAKLLGSLRHPVIGLAVCKAISATLHVAGASTNWSPSPRPPAVLVGEGHRLYGAVERQLRLRRFRLRRKLP